jgi:hypothetical protein
MSKVGNYLAVFGGRRLCSEQPFVESIFMLKLDSLTWIRLEASTQALRRSEFISGNIMVPSGGHGILIMGGIDEKFHVSNKI